MLILIGCPSFPLLLAFLPVAEDGVKHEEDQQYEARQRDPHSGTCSQTTRVDLPCKILKVKKNYLATFNSKVIHFVFQKDFFKYIIFARLR